MISAYEIFRHAFGLFHIFSAVLWVYLIAGDANIFLLVFGIVIGLFFAVVNYLLMFFLSDFDRINNYLLGSKSIPIHEMLNLKTAYIFTAAFSLYSLVIFAFFQPHGDFLIFQFFVHISLGIAPILSFYLFLFKGRRGQDFFELNTGGTSIITDVLLLIISLLGIYVKNLYNVANILGFTLISLAAPYFGHYMLLYSYSEDKYDNIFIIYLIGFVFILTSASFNIFTYLVLQSSKSSLTSEK